MVYSYPREIYETRIKDLDLKIIGVDHGFTLAHKLDFLKENQGFLRDEINNPDCDYLFFEMGLKRDLFYQNLAGFLGAIGLDVLLNSSLWIARYIWKKCNYR